MPADPGPPSIHFSPVYSFGVESDLHASKKSLTPRCKVPLIAGLHPVACRAVLVGSNLRERPLLGEGVDPVVHRPVGDVKVPVVVGGEGVGLSLRGYLDTPVQSSATAVPRDQGRRARDRVEGLGSRRNMLSEQYGCHMADSPRALLTAGERAAIRGNEDMDQNTRSSHLSRVRRKMKKMREDVALLREHAPDRARELEEIVCTDGEGNRLDELADRIEDLDERVRALESEEETESDSDAEYHPQEDEGET